MAEPVRKYRLYIFDADGTLRRCTVPGQPCPNKPGEWELLPNVKERLAQIDWKRCDFGIASNQGGVALGHLTYWMARDLIVDMVKELFGAGPGARNRPGPFPPTKPIDVEVCPHAPDAGCVCRKPSPYMLWSIMVQHDALPAETLYVGDQDSDAEAAKRAGVDFARATDFFDDMPF